LGTLILWIGPLKIVLTYKKSFLDVDTNTIFYDSSAKVKLFLLKIIVYLISFKSN